ncbi:MAG: O-antigen ligase family protein [Patescibacteria group bacterium]|nr:O-antigen ligase family protein [Patescibacteria group bacterium]
MGTRDNKIYLGATWQKLGLILIVIVLGYMSVFVPIEYVAGFLICALLIGLFIKKTIWGIYLIAVLYPFIYLQLWLGQDINVPYVDLIAMLVFTAWFLKTIYNWIKHKQQLSLKNFPGLFYFIPFVVAASLSLINIENVNLGIKYILRPLVFFYLMFVILPYNTIKTKKQLITVFKIMFGVGIVVALMGCWSLIRPITPGLFRRAVPIPILGYNILGTNHNLIAEVLIAVIPLAFILIWQTYKIIPQKWLIVGLVFMMMINLMTLSRTGWICLILEILILGLVVYRRQLNKLTPYILLILILIIPFVYYMYDFLDSSFVSSSNLNRLRQTQIALESFKLHPILGAGVGTFMEQVAQDKWYILDFGSPIEAHGVIQKLLAEVGFVGLISFLILLGFVIVQVIKTYIKLDYNSEWKMIILALILSVIGSIVFQLFNTSYYVSKMWWPLGIALTASHLALKNQNEQEN